MGRGSVEREGVGGRSVEGVRVWEGEVWRV